jgi:hypothetical protein
MYGPTRVIVLDALPEFPDASDAVTSMALAPIASGTDSADHRCSQKLTHEEKRQPQTGKMLWKVPPLSPVAWFSHETSISVVVGHIMNGQMPTADSRGGHSGHSAVPDRSAVAVFTSVSTLGSSMSIRTCVKAAPPSPPPPPPVARMLSNPKTIRGLAAK